MSGMTSQEDVCYRPNWNWLRTGRKYNSTPHPLLLCQLETNKKRRAHGQPFFCPPSSADLQVTMERLSPASHLQLGRCMAFILSSSALQATMDNLSSASTSAHLQVFFLSVLCTILVSVSCMVDENWFCAVKACHSMNWTTKVIINFCQETSLPSHKPSPF